MGLQEFLELNDEQCRKANGNEDIDNCNCSCLHFLVEQHFSEFPKNLWLFKKILEFMIRKKDERIFFRYRLIVLLFFICCHLQKLEIFQKKHIFEIVLIYMFINSKSGFCHCEANLMLKLLTLSLNTIFTINFDTWNIHRDLEPDWEYESFYMRNPEHECLRYFNNAKSMYRLFELISEKLDEDDFHMIKSCGIDLCGIDHILYRERYSYRNLFLQNEKFVSSLYMTCDIPMDILGAVLKFEFLAFDPHESEIPVTFDPEDQSTLKDELKQIYGITYHEPLNTLIGSSCQRPLNDCETKLLEKTINLSFKILMSRLSYDKFSQLWENNPAIFKHLMTECIENDESDRVSSILVHCFENLSEKYSVIVKTYAKIIISKDKQKGQQLLNTILKKYTRQILDPSLSKTSQANQTTFRTFIDMLDFIVEQGMTIQQELKPSLLAICLENSKHKSVRKLYNILTVSN